MENLSSRPEVASIKKQLHKLADYEVSGLSPEEVISFVNSNKGQLSLDLILTKAELAKVTSERDATIYALRLYTEDCLTCDSEGCDTCEHTFASEGEKNYEFDITRFTREREKHGRI